jgi:hypothetical protein
MAQDTGQGQFSSTYKRPAPVFQPRRKYADVRLLKEAVSEFLSVTDENNFEFLTKIELRRQMSSAYSSAIMSMAHLQSMLDLFLTVENKGINLPLKEGPCDKQGPSLQAPSAPTVSRKTDNFSDQLKVATEELKTFPPVPPLRSSIRLKSTCSKNDSAETKAAANTLMQLKLNCAVGPECQIHTTGIRVNPLSYAIGSALLGPNEAEDGALGMIGDKLKLHPHSTLLESTSPYICMSEEDAKLHRQRKRANVDEIDSDPPPTKVVIRDAFRMAQVRKWIEWKGFKSLPYPPTEGDPVYLPRLGPMKTYQITRRLFLEMLASGSVQVTSKTKWRKAIQSYPPISSTLHEQLLDERELVFKLGNLAYIVTKSDEGHVRMAPSAINIFFDDRL